MARSTRASCTISSSATTCSGDRLPGVLRGLRSRGQSPVEVWGHDAAPASGRAARVARPLLPAAAREPWTDEVRWSRAPPPDHDWNERITAQCYRPNTASRVLDGYGRIQSIGQQLPAHLLQHRSDAVQLARAPATRVCQRILAADRSSAAAHGGHGNAMAQAYNHMICRSPTSATAHADPLGAARVPASLQAPGRGMWLPETAIDAQTVEALIDCGVRFTVLSPYQARRVRGLNDGAWVDAPTAGSIRSAPTVFSAVAPLPTVPGAISTSSSTTARSRAP